MPKTFEDYFKSKPALTGSQSSVGDEVLVLRNGTVFRGSSVFNKAFASINHNSNFLGLNTQNQWYKITGLTDVLSTPSFTFANDAYTYVGPTQIYPAIATLSVTISKFFNGTGGEEYEIGIFVNGALYQNTMSTTCPEDPTQQAKSNVVCSVALNLGQGDVIDARILNRSGTDDVKVEDLQLIIQQ